MAQRPRWRRKERSFGLDPCRSRLRDSDLNVIVWETTPETAIGEWRMRPEWKEGVLSRELPLWVMGAQLLWAALGVHVTQCLAQNHLNERAKKLQWEELLPGTLLLPACSHSQRRATEREGQVSAAIFSVDRYMYPET